MNHCHDCNSMYSQPGTCNCFAPGGKREVRWVRSGPVAPIQGYEWGTATPRMCPLCQQIMGGIHLCGNQFDGCSMEFPS